MDDRSSGGATDDRTGWSCFTDPGTGRSYRSRAAAERSATDLRLRTTCDTRDLVNAVRRLEAARVDDATLLRHPCAEHDNGGVRAVSIGNAARPTTDTDVLLINLDSAMMPLLVTDSDAVDPVTNQVYTDDLRRREADSEALETLRLELQAKHGRPVLFVIAYGSEANARTTRDLARSGIPYFETPVIGSFEELERHLKHLMTLDYRRLVV